MHYYFCLVTLGCIADFSHARVPLDLATRVQTRIELGILTKSELVTGAVRPFVTPLGHDAGTSHHEMHRADGPTPALIKLVAPSRDADITQTSASLRKTMAGLLLGEAAGGPRIYRAGLYADGARLGHYVVMEHLFADDVTFTYKGIRDGRVDVAPFHLEARWPELARLIRRVLELNIQMDDVDFIVSPRGVRWIDTTMWRVAEPRDARWQLHEVASILRWAEAHHFGHGRRLYLYLRAELIGSTILAADDKANLLNELSLFRAIFRQEGPRPVRRMMKRWWWRCARRLSGI